MTNKTRVYSIISGVSLLIMTFAAAYSYGYVHTQIMAQTMDQTIKTIQSSPLLLTGLIGWFIIIVTDALYSFM